MNVNTGFNMSNALVAQKDFYNDPMFRLPEGNVVSRMSDTGFSSFVEESYSNPEGYAIRWNPRTHKKEMMIAGTRSGRDWLANLGDTLWERNNLGFQRTPWMERAMKKYEAIARREGVSVIYGHSRGGAIVADMKFKGDKVGLNAAMLMGHNKTMTNYRGGSMFDKVLATGGKKNIYKRSKFHKVWAN